MDITLSFKGLEDKLQIISEEVALVPGVQRTDFAPAALPDPTKKAGAQAVSDLIVKLVPDAIEALIAAIGSIVKHLTPSPTKVVVSIGSQAVTIEFDPRFETSVQVARATNEILERIQGATPNSSVR